MTPWSSWYSIWTGMIRELMAKVRLAARAPAGIASTVASATQAPRRVARAGRAPRARDVAAGMGGLLTIPRREQEGFLTRDPETPVFPRAAGGGRAGAAATACTCAAACMWARSEEHTSEL